jgi:NADPH:quinone reductase-like Zn-dependent oxidoreductase
VRAFAVERLGDAPAILELAKPTSPRGYVVRVTHAGVNPLDYKLVDSLTSQSSYPFVLGIDFAGVLEELPSAEHELAAGDRVRNRTHKRFLCRIHRCSGKRQSRGTGTDSGRDC